MTSPSPRNPRITASNTRRRITNAATLLAAWCGLFSSPAIAADDAAPSADALERLKQRSAEVRWDKAVEEWLPLEPRQTPAVQDPGDPWRNDPSKPASPAVPPPTPPATQEPAPEPAPTANVPAPLSGDGLVPPPAQSSPQQPQTARSPWDNVAGEHVGGLLQPRVSAFPEAPTPPPTSVEQPIAVRNSERAPPAPEALIATKFDVPAARAQEYLSLEAFLSGAPLIVSGASDDHAGTIQLLVDDPSSATQAPGRALLPVPDYISLRPITNIVPFRTYSPDGSDPCEHLCPLPEGCEDSAETLCPDVYELPVVGSTDRVFAGLNYYWLASNVTYNPLYFEDPTLERYGHVHIYDCIEPLYGIGRFGVQLLGLPYQMAMRPPCERVSPLGYFRPGEPAPKRHYQIPFDGRAAAIATGVYTGLFFLVP